MTVLADEHVLSERSISQCYEQENEYRGPCAHMDHVISSNPPLHKFHDYTAKAVLRPSSPRRGFRHFLRRCSCRNTSGPSLASRRRELRHVLRHVQRRRFPAHVVGANLSF